LTICDKVASGNKNKKKAQLEKLPHSYQFLSIVINSDFWLRFLLHKKALKSFLYSLTICDKVASGNNGCWQKVLHAAGNIFFPIITIIVILAKLIAQYNCERTSSYRTTRNSCSAAKLYNVVVYSARGKSQPRFLRTTTCVAAIKSNQPPYTQDILALSLSCSTFYSRVHEAVGSCSHAQTAISSSTLKRRVDTFSFAILFPFHHCKFVTNFPSLCLGYSFNLPDSRQKVRFQQIASGQPCFQSKATSSISSNLDSCVVTSQRR
jgi:hypothetical protein